MGEGVYVLFLSKPTGYELLERPGEPPAVGTELEEDGVRVGVSKIGPSPLPGDQRPCVFTQAL